VIALATASAAWPGERPDVQRRFLQGVPVVRLVTVSRRAAADHDRPRGHPAPLRIGRDAKHRGVGGQQGRCPNPNIARPRAWWSSWTIRSAVVSGWWYGNEITPVPSRIRRALDGAAMNSSGDAMIPSRPSGVPRSRPRRSRPVQELHKLDLPGGWPRLATE